MQPPQDEHEDLSESWENSPKRGNQLWVSILYFLHREKLHFTRNPSNHAPTNMVAQSSYHVAQGHRLEADG